MNKKYKILIVEDQPITAMDIKQTITNLGYEVVGIAKSYENAIRKFEENIPDLVIMDICLNEGIDGIDTVKQLYKIKKIPVIYLTAFTDDLQQRRGDVHCRSFWRTGIRINGNYDRHLPRECLLPSHMGA
jgi:CheY-like chemotaxis protein